MSNNLIRFLFSALLFNLFSISAFALNGNLPGDGTEDNPYLIEDSIDLCVFANSVNASKYWSTGVHARLTADVNGCYGAYTILSDAIIAGQNYLDTHPIESHFRRVPINEVVIDDTIPVVSNDGIIYLPAIEYNGVEYEDITTHEIATGYSGIFDGAGYSIYYYLTTYDSYAYDSAYCGVFGKINSSGVVKNLVVDNIDVIAANVTGIICGENEGLIDNCVTSGTLTYGTAIGGICGINKGMITNSSFRGVVQAVNDAGGIAGINYGQIDQCCVKANIRAKSYAGGIAGINGDYENSTEAYITNSYAIGSVYSSMGALCFNRNGMDVNYDCGTLPEFDNNYAGGITALNVAGSVEYCYCSTDALNGAGTVLSGNYCNITDRALDGTTLASFARSSAPQSQYQWTDSEMLIADNWLNAGWINDDIWQIDDNSYPILANTSVVDNWDRFDAQRYLPGDPEPDPEPEVVHHYSLALEQGMKTFSFGSSTILDAKLFDDDVEVTEDCSITWERISVVDNDWYDDCYIMEDGMIYNTNSTGNVARLTFKATATIGDKQLSKECSVCLLPKIEEQTMRINKAIVKAAPNRNKPNDLLYLSMAGLDYPDIIAEDIERDSTITVEIFEEDNPDFTPILRVFDIEETYDSSVYFGKVVDTAKIINTKLNYLGVNFKSGRHYSFSERTATLKLRGLDLTGLTDGFTVRISNNQFIAQANAADVCAPGNAKSLIARDINGSRPIPICLTKNISNHVNGLKVKSRASTSGRRNGAVLISGYYSLSQQADLISNGLAVKLGDNNELRINSDIASYSDDGLDSSDPDITVNDTPNIAEVKNGVYFVKYSCGLPGEKQTIVKGVFNSRSQRFILKVFNIETEKVDTTDVQFKIAPFEPGSIMGVFDDLDNSDLING